MEYSEIQQILKGQKDYFATGATLPVKVRKEALRRLLAAVESNEEQLLKALQQDLGKGRMEGYMCEIALVKSEIRFLCRHLARYAKEKRVRTPLAQSVSRSFVKPVPYGSVLIMSPWNYPVLLSLEPLVDALAAGNTAVVKPSAYAPATADLLEKLIGETFSPSHVALVKGGRTENAALLDCDFDDIFFTGSKAVGKEVMRKASERLIPVTLELGGKSPCIVDQTANLKLAAKRIVFGKFINCGQTCVAPDYIYCHEDVKDALVEELGRQIEQQYGKQPLDSSDYGTIVNQKHFDRICGLLDPEKVVFGGQTRAQTLQIAPTVMDRVTWDDAVMGEEIFGPILPVLTYRNLQDVAAIIRSKDAPLALYVFSADNKNIRFVTEQIPYGGGCINDTLIHLATSAMGFGGVGASGMGAYHGKCGFDTFSHQKSIVDKKTWLDLPMRYRPYTLLNERLVRWFVR